MESLLAQEHAIYLTPLYYSEKGVAGGLERLLREGARPATPLSHRHPSTGRNCLRMLKQLGGVQLAPQQQQAVRAALTHRLVVLTGGPGTGKTTTVRTILLLCRQAGYRVSAGCADRARRQAFGRNNRPGSQDPTPTAGIQTGRRHGVQTQ